MRIDVICPEGPIATRGNRASALRIARLLRERHDVRVAAKLGKRPGDACIALHAGRSAGAIVDYAARAPHGRLVVLLTGTDVYGDRALSPDVMRSLQLAWRIVAAQPLAFARIDRDLRDKARAIPKSATVPPAAAEASRSATPSACLEVVALSHLRAEKDPLLLARAMDLLPSTSSLRAVHLGGALDDRSAKAAHAAHSERWQWIGPRPRSSALLRLARARALVLTSRVEGAPNVIAEAAALGRPILATAIDGVIGMLGDSHPGLFPVGDARALARLLTRLEHDEAFVRALATKSRQLARAWTPRAEQAAWERLLREPEPEIYSLSAAPSLAASSRRPRSRGSAR
ncbi:MAG: hypothetical protein RLZZ562_880 [Planctomycetota bacterium]|jgi:putative glycosyltransferase (TIGR04348 family)